MAAVDPTEQQQAELVPEQKPFQRLQFLLRDWQNFDSDYEEGQSDLVYQSLRADMQKYLADVLRTRGVYAPSMTMILLVIHANSCLRRAQ